MTLLRTMAGCLALALTVTTGVQVAEARGHGGGGRGGAMHAGGGHMHAPHHSGGHGASHSRPGPRPHPGANQGHGPHHSGGDSHYHGHDHGHDHGGDHAHGGHHGGHHHHAPSHPYWYGDNDLFWGAATGLTLGAMVASTPDTGCDDVRVGNVIYKHCGGTWLQPVYDGHRIVYLVVEAPR